MGAIVLEGRSESNGDRSGQENKKENRSPRIYQGRREGITSTLKSKNAVSQNYEADQKNGRVIALESVEAWDQPRPSQATIVPLLEAAGTSFLGNAMFSCP